MAVGDIYQVKVFQTYLSQAVLNVYFYRQQTTGTPDDAAGLFGAIDNGILSNQMGCVGQGLSVTSVEVFRPDVPSDFAQGVPVNNVGLRVIASADRSPAFVSFGYQSNRAGAGTRVSSKRYCGIQDQDYDGNLLTAAFKTFAPVEALRISLGTPISDGISSGLYLPIQVKHPVPLGFPVVENFVITDWIVPYLTSQVSRRSPTGL